MEIICFPAMFYKIRFVTTSCEKIQAVYKEELFITVQYIFFILFLFFFRLMVFMQQKTWVVVLKKFIWVGGVSAYVFEKKNHHYSLLFVNDCQLPETVVNCRTMTNPPTSPGGFV